MHYSSSKTNLRLSLYYPELRSAKHEERYIDENCSEDCLGNTFEVRGVSNEEGTSVMKAQYKTEAMRFECNVLGMELN